MLHLRGCPALSEFRLLKLRDQISALVPALSKVRADFLHVAELNESLADAERAVLDKLLSYGPAQAGVAGGGVMLISSSPSPAGRSTCAAAARRPSRQRRVPSGLKTTTPSWFGPP